MEETTAHEDKNVDLVTYELGYHLVPSLGEDALALRVTELTTAITDLGGAVLSSGDPESLVLAYTVSKMRAGKWDNYDTSFFGWVRFTAPAEEIASLKDTLDHNEVVMRYFIMKLPKEALLVPTPTLRRTVAATAPQDEEGVLVEPKVLEKREDEEVKADVSEEELDKQLEQLIS
jgi:ribosomal protein S6